MRGQLGALQAACAALKGSADLMTVLRAVLLTGNHLNEGTHRGAADGAPSHAVHTVSSALGVHPEQNKRVLSSMLAAGALHVLQGSCMHTIAPAAHTPVVIGFEQGMLLVVASVWAHAGFRLDTLLKLADVKGTDRRTSLLHFVLAQLVAAEGAGVAALAAQLAAVRPAANLQARATPWESTM